jgi:hypothetical protein
LVVIAQAPPPIPATHPIPIDPAADAATCFQCHVSAELPPAEQTAFCATCHLNLHVRFAVDQPVVRPAPDPPHPIDTTWTSADCAFCHRLQHNGRNATHQITTEMRNAAFCVVCHTTGQVQFTGEESAGDFCFRCHNIGVLPEHPVAEAGQTAEFCLACHVEE